MHLKKWYFKKEKGDHIQYSVAKKTIMNTDNVRIYLLYMTTC